MLAVGQNLTGVELRSPILTSETDSIRTYRELTDTQDEQLPGMEKAFSTVADGDEGRIIEFCVCVCVCINGEVGKRRKVKKQSLAENRTYVP